MNVEFDLKGGRHMPAFQFMVLDMLSNVLSSADNPGAMGRYLTHELRELTGARTVILLQCLHSFGGGGHRPVSVNPERRRPLAESVDVERLAELAHQLDEPVMWEVQGEAEADKILARLECGLSLAVPLNVGANRVGVLFLLDLPDREHISSVVKMSAMLSTVIALIFRNALLFEKQEAIIEQRTRELKESERLFRTLAQVSPVGIFRTDADGRYTYVNERWCEIAGLSPEEAYGENWVRGLHPEDRERVFREWRQAAKDDLPFRSEYRFQHPDGVTMWVFGQAKSEAGGRGEITGYVGTITDITERVQVEDLIRAQRNLVLELGAAVGLGEMLRLCVETAIRSTGMDAGGVYLIDEISGELNLALSKGVSPDFVKATSRYVADSANARLVMAGKPIYISYQELGVPRDETRRREGLRVIAILPVLYEGQVVACLNIASRSLGEIPAAARNTLEMIAAQIGSFVARARAEAKVLHLQFLLQNITDSMPSALVTLDPVGRVLTWNPAAEALTGRLANQVLGQSLWQTCPELDRYRGLFERVLQEGQVAHQHKEQVVTEAGVAYRDVSVFPLAANATGSARPALRHLDVQPEGCYVEGLPKRSPRVEGVVLRIDDVTQRVQMEEMMLQSAKLASVGGLAAGVAHEINNPLSAMIQGAQVLQMAFDTQRPRTRERLQVCGVDPEGLECYLQERGLIEYLAGICSTGERAAKIVSDLLSFSRRAPFQARPHDLNALVEQTIELAATDYNLRRKYDFRDIEIVREFTPDLPEVVCDGQQIQQVVLNLVRNAAQAMAAERSEWRIANSEWQPRLTLRTAYREEIVNRKPVLSEVEGSKIVNRMVRLEVEDNGPGIPEAVQARLFDPFFTTKEVGEGTGLGLWLCWSIVVEHHEGRIWAEPAAERGSRFVVELPVELSKHLIHTD